MFLFWFKIWNSIFNNIFNNKQDTITASAPLDFSQNITEFLKKKIIKLLVKRLYDRANIIAANSKELGKDLSLLIN